MPLDNTGRTEGVNEFRCESGYEDECMGEFRCESGYEDECMGDG